MADHALKQAMSGVKRAVKRAARETAASGKRHNVNVAGRRNVVVSRNVGGEGSTRQASATQTTHITQHSGQNAEDSDTVSTAEES